jgi:hypothetical protein
MIEIAAKAFVSAHNTVCLCFLVIAACYHRNQTTNGGWDHRIVKKNKSAAQRMFSVADGTGNWRGILLAPQLQKSIAEKSSAVRAPF